MAEKQQQETETDIKPEAVEQEVSEQEQPEETLASAIDAALDEEAPAEGGETESTDGEQGEEESAETPGAEESKDEDADKEKVSEQAKGNQPGDETAETDDDIPEGLSERAQTRFRALRDRAVAAEQNVNQFTEMLQSTGANPQEFGMLMEYSRLVHSNAPQDAEQALRILDAERDALAKRLGRELPGQDMLSEFPDLASRVENMEIDRSAALEIAHARRSQAAFTQQQQAQQQQQYQQQQAQQSEQRAMQALDQLGAQLSQSDPDYQAKLNILIQHSVPWIKQNLPPAQWAGAFQNAYKQLGATLATQRETETRNKRPAPLRPGGSGGGSKREPGSMEDAIAQALGAD